MKISRISFNGGELSPAAELRADLDVYARGCSSVLNMEIGQMGGVRRRRGMASVVPAMSDHSRIVSVTYSQDDSYIFEFYSLNGLGKLRVLDPAGNAQVIAVHLAGVAAWNTPEIIRSLSIQQVNDLVYVCCGYFSPKVISRYMENGVYKWKIDHLFFKNAPVDSLSENPVSLKGSIGKSGHGTLESPAFIGLGNATDTGAQVVVRGVQPSRTYSGDSANSDGSNWWIDWAKTPNLQTENIEKGKVVKNNVGDNHNDFFTCIRYYPASAYRGSQYMRDYPDYFKPGMIWIPNIDISGGKWSVQTSGTWHGGYILRRSYGYDNNGNLIEEDIKTLVSNGDRNYNTVFDQLGERGEINVYLKTLVANGTLTKLLIEVEPYACDFTFDLGNKGEGGVSSNAFMVTKAHPYKMPSEAYFETSDWSFSACSPATGYFRAVTLHNSRLVFAGTSSRPQTIWMSKVDDLYNFRTGSNDDDGLHITLATTAQNAIRWISSQQRKLYAGTAEAEWIISGGDKPLTPTSVSAERHTTIGSAPTGALMAENAVLYTERGGKRLRRYGYNYEVDGYQSMDLTVFADHILASGVREVGYQRSPDAVIWAVLNDGTMATMTYNTMHNVHAWGRVETAGQVKSVTVIPDPTGKGDEVWLVATRDGSHYIEVMRDGNPLKDHGHSYASEVITNCMESVETSGSPKNSTEVMVCFREALASSLRIYNGSVWTTLSANFYGTLTGWQQITASCQWGRQFAVGVRVEDDSPLSILGIKAIYN